MALLLGCAGVAGKAAFTIQQRRPSLSPQRARGMTGLTLPRAPSGETLHMCAHSQARCGLEGAYAYTGPAVSLPKHVQGVWMGECLC